MSKKRISKLSHSISFILYKTSKPFGIRVVIVHHYYIEILTFLANISRSIARLIFLDYGNTERLLHTKILNQPLILNVTQRAH